MATNITGLNLTTSALVFLKVTAGASSDLLVGGFGKAVVGPSSTLSVSGANFSANASFRFAASALGYQKTIVNGNLQTMRISDIKKKTALIAASLETNVGRKMMEQIDVETYATANEVNERRDEIVETRNVKTGQATEILTTCSETVEEINSIITDYQTTSNEINRMIESSSQIIAECNQVISSQASTVQNNVALSSTNSHAYGASIVD